MWLTRSTAISVSNCLSDFIIIIERQKYGKQFLKTARLQYKSEKKQLSDDAAASLTISWLQMTSKTVQHPVAV